MHRFVALVSFMQLGAVQPNSAALHGLPASSTHLFLLRHIDELRTYGAPTEPRATK